MTQPPYGGAPPPEGQPYPPDPANPYGQPGYGQPAYPPAQDPYASPPVSGQPAPGYPPPGGYSTPDQYPAPGQPTSGQPYGAPGQPVSGDPYAQPAHGDPYGQPGHGDPFTPTPPGYPGGLPYQQPAQPPYPTSGQPYPVSGGFPPSQPGYTPYPAAAPPKKKRGALIGAIITIVLVLCAGGSISAWLLLRNVETGEGAAEPVAAVEAFMKAVYTDHDAAKAAKLVCSEARDEAELSRKVEEVKGYDTRFDNPTFDWDDPKVDDKTDERAIVSVKLTMLTGDEKTANLDLKFTVVQKTGWWICEIG